MRAATTERVSAPAQRQDNRDIIAAIERLARQPIEVQSQINLDGRRIGQAVARHNRDETVKEMG